MSATGYSTEELTRTSIEQFKAFMKFIGDHDLWDKAEEALKGAGITEVAVSSEPIRVIRTFITDKMLSRADLGRDARAQALFITRCGCGVSTPGPGHGPVSPVGGGGDAGAGGSKLQ
jgi:hypothetical protein